MIRITNLSKMQGATRLEPVPDESGAGPATRPLTLLIIEDDPTMRLAMACMLADDDRQVVTAGSAEEALAHLQLIEPDLILCDYVLAGMNGREFCATLRAVPRWQQVPIIMVTGLDIPAVLSDLLHSGADDVVTKPLRPGELCARVELRLRANPRPAIAGSGTATASARGAGALPRVSAPVALRRRQFQSLVKL